MLKRIISRPYLVGAALVLQFAWLFICVEYLSENFMVVSFFVQVISVVAMLWVLNKQDSAEFKLPWIILILTAPFIGGIVYFLTSGDGVFKKQKERYAAARSVADASAAWELNEELPTLRKLDTCCSGQFTYLEKKGFPVYAHTQCRYYPMGDDAFPDMLAAFQSAKQYIFLEYFIIYQNSMWTEILNVLEERAANGVEVRVLYDDMATMTSLPSHYPKELAAKGIACIAFNPFIPVCKIGMNHRDHRKIAVVDGEIAFTGGFNLSDEYVNRSHPHGDSWKDTGVRLEGDAACQMTRFFLTMWDACTGQVEDYAPYCLKEDVSVPESDGFVQPYTHEPLQGGQILTDIYRNLINQSSEYLYIYTPYLIPDTGIMDALCLAADRGVDVRLMLPGVPDKRLIWQMSKSHFSRLLKHGVQLYEYAPGFLHAKCMVSDDKVATVGSGNLDYRSLYHSFEDGCLFYESSVVKALREDFLATQTECRRVDRVKTPTHIFSSVYYAILRVFSPLL